MAGMNNETGGALFCGTPRALILGLLLPRGPSAVCRTVVAVIVRIAVNGMLCRRLRSHVHKKCFERFAPSTADLDPAAAVILKLCGFRIVTALLDCAPCQIFGGLARGQSVTMADERHSPLASATLNMTGAKRAARRCDRPSTTTIAKPFDTLAARSKAVSYCELAEMLAAKINGCWHGGLAWQG